MKPGYQTTEFWVTLIMSAVPVLVALGVFSPEEGQTIAQQWADIAVQVGSLVAAAIVAWKYISSRTFLKSLDEFTQE